LLLPTTARPFWTAFARASRTTSAYSARLTEPTNAGCFWVGRMSSASACAGPRGRPQSRSEDFSRNLSCCTEHDGT
jgi:hypothetical protein